MSNGYIKSLDGVRALAILLVMSFHFGLDHFGWLGVQLFFVLSGYLISGILWKEKFSESNLRDKFKKFWARRSLRIFPLYFGFLLAITLIYLIFSFPSYYPTYAPFLATYTVNFTRTLTDWHTNPLFTHLWSLSVEEQFYFIFPLIVFLFPAGFVKRFMVFFILVTPAVRFLLGRYYFAEGLEGEVVADAIYWNTLSHLDAFFMGGIIPVLSLHKKIKKPQLLFAFSVFVIIVAGLWNYYQDNSVFPYFRDLGYGHGQTGNYEHIWHYTVLNIGFASFILMLVAGGQGLVVPVIRKVLESNWMVKIGRVSYGMYVFHWAVIIYLFDRYLQTDNYLLRLLLFIPYSVVVYIIAELSYRLFEVRFINLKDKLFAYKAKANQKGE